MFRRVVGPTCPKCECPDSVVVGSGVRWGQPFELRRCRHCRHRFRANVQKEEEDEPAEPDEPGQAVPYTSTRSRCPFCDAPNPKVTCTMTELSTASSTFRRHKCAKCGNTFKSREVL